MPLRLLFFGTPAFAVPTLERLHDSAHEVVGVVMQPDRPHGRGHRVSAGPVKVSALDRGLSITQPEKLKDPAWLETVASWRPDVAVVAAYGRILPQVVLDLPRLGVINVHASLLPRWRGAAPVHRAILAGDTTTGVTIMRVVLALDAGPMLDHVTTAIAPDETSDDVERRLAGLGADVLVRVVDRLSAGPIEARAQDESLVTYAPRLERRDSQIDWARPAIEIHNQIRGLQPWPLAGAVWRDRRILFRHSQIEPAGAGSPGSVTAVDRDAFVVAAGSGAVRILALQEAGRAPMTARDFLNGRHVAVGDVFEPLPIS